MTVRPLSTLAGRLLPRFGDRTGGAESWRTRLTRWRYNLDPTYRRTGGRITFIADDWREIRVQLPLTRRTRSYAGTIFGGAMFAAFDPFFMIMLIKVLGPGHVVWDKAATIQFRRPGRSTLEGRFVLPPGAIEEIRSRLADAPKTERVFTVELTSADGTVHAVIDKTVHVRRHAPGAAGARLHPTPATEKGSDT